jgi:hypothetical protein
MHFGRRDKDALPVPEARTFSMKVSVYCRYGKLLGLDVLMA